jgi:hypothetical protein
MTDVLDRETDAETALLVVPEFKDALSIFTKPDATGADNLLNVVRSKVDAFLKERPDVSTEAGRAAIRSFAHKVVKSKTALEEVGKALAAEQKEIPKRIVAGRGAPAAHGLGEGRGRSRQPHQGRSRGVPSRDR